MPKKGKEYLCLKREKGVMPKREKGIYALKGKGVIMPKKGIILKRA